MSDLAVVDPLTAPRSCLVVPGHKDRMHDKAAEVAADEIVFDLEDAVPDADKKRARDAVLALLTEPRWRDRRLAVRVNGFGTSEHAGDIAAIARCDHPTLSIVVPKAESPEQLDAVSLKLGSTRPIQALIESPLGLAKASSIARNLSARRWN